MKRRSTSASTESPSWSAACAATSFNRKLAQRHRRSWRTPEFSFKQVQIGDLPLYNQDDDAHQAESVKRLKGEIRAAQGLLFVTAEYNRSIPGVLKNAIDHASRPYGQSAWAGKPAGVLGVSVGAIGTALAQQHLRNVLAYLDVPTLGQPEAFIQAKDGLFDEAGDIGASSRLFLQTWMDRYAAWVRQHATERGHACRAEVLAAVERADLRQRLEQTPYCGQRWSTIWARFSLKAVTHSSTLAGGPSLSGSPDGSLERRLTRAVSKRSRSWASVSWTSRPARNARPASLIFGSLRLPVNEPLELGHALGAVLPHRHLRPGREAHAVLVLVQQARVAEREAEVVDHEDGAAAAGPSHLLPFRAEQALVRGLAVGVLDERRQQLQRVALGACAGRRFGADVLQLGPLPAGVPPWSPWPAPAASARWPRGRTPPPLRPFPGCAWGPWDSRGSGRARDTSGRRRSPGPRTGAWTAPRRRPRRCVGRT